MTSSLIDLEPTMKFSCSDVHPGFLDLRIMSIRFEYCFRVSSQKKVFFLPRFPWVGCGLTDFFIFLGEWSLHL